MTYVRPVCSDDLNELQSHIAALATQHDDIASGSLAQLEVLCLGPRPWFEVLVAERGEALVGYAALTRKGQLQFARRAMDLHHLFVVPSARNQGVGRLLLSAAVDLSHQLGASFLTVGADLENTRAHSFYLNAGFDKSPQKSAQFVYPLGLHAS